ncbi:hypothetical protein [Egbenema bharatensis]|uniref:hypothetical protein n=1 Tax=Egbenema bharatensis TaxID=3463334 RepID=UPI003A8C7B6E
MINVYNTEILLDPYEESYKKSYRSDPRSKSNQWEVKPRLETPTLETQVLQLIRPYPIIKSLAYEFTNKKLLKLFLDKPKVEIILQSQDLQIQYEQGKLDRFPKLLELLKQFVARHQLWETGSPQDKHDLLHSKLLLLYDAEENLKAGLGGSANWTQALRKQSNEIYVFNHSRNPQILQQLEHKYQFFRNLDSLTPVKFKNNFGSVQFSDLSKESQVNPGFKGHKKPSEILSVIPKKRTKKEKSKLRSYQAKNQNLEDANPFKF